MDQAQGVQAHPCAGEMVVQGGALRPQGFEFLLPHGAVGLAQGLEEGPGHRPAGVEAAEIDDIFRQCDVTSLHCPLTDATKHLVGERTLNLMKREAMIINTGRGPLVDEPALAKALNEGRIAGAGLDVLSVEPAKADNPLLAAKNCLITPHVAWASRESRARLIDITAANLQAFLAGKPVNVVNG